jgi:hypothetical protein
VKSWCPHVIILLRGRAKLLCTRRSARHSLAQRLSSPALNRAEAFLDGLSRRGEDRRKDGQ